MISKARKPLIFLIVGFIILIIIALIISESGINWTVPDSLIGDWTGKHKVTLRFKQGLMKYSFLTGKDSIDICFNINKDGKVTGTIGSATIDGSSIFKNRGVIRRMLKMNTDFDIKGNIRGNIFSEDKFMFRQFMCPINLEGNLLKGAIFQKDGWDIFPMVELKLIKKK